MLRRNTHQEPAPKHGQLVPRPDPQAFTDPIMQGNHHPAAADEEVG